MPQQPTAQTAPTGTYPPLHQIHRRTPRALLGLLPRLHLVRRPQRPLQTPLTRRVNDAFDTEGGDDGLLSRGG